LTMIPSSLHAWSSSFEPRSFVVVSLPMRADNSTLITTLSQQALVSQIPRVCPSHVSLGQ
jgi:hypothetical protein